MEGFRERNRQLEEKREEASARKAEMEKRGPFDPPRRRTWSQTQTAQGGYSELIQVRRSVSGILSVRIGVHDRAVFVALSKESRPDPESRPRSRSRSSVRSSRSGSRASPTARLRQLSMDSLSLTGANLQSRALGVRLRCVGRALVDSSSVRTARTA